MSRPSRPPKFASTRAKKAAARPPEEKEALTAKCVAIRTSHPPVPKHRRETADQLPRWVKLALTHYETEDITLREAAGRLGKAGSTLEKYAMSPAGKEWRARVAAVADTPEKLAEMTLKAQVASVALDYLLAMQMALDAGDFKEFGVMSRDYLDRVGLTKKTTDSGGRQQLIVIKLGGDSTLEAPLVESSYSATNPPSGGIEGIDYLTESSDSESPPS